MPEKNKTSNASMSLDEFFTLQARTSVRATLEPIEGDDINLKITPWLEGEGCLCAYALTIPRKALRQVSPTGESHICCGKRLLVVEVEFSDKSTLSVSDVFQQFLHLASQPFHSNPHPDHALSFPVQDQFGYQSAQSYPGRVLGCPSGYEPCNGACYNREFQCCCCRPNGECFVRDNSRHQSCFHVCR